jgi:F-type H+-transporting ATPase subunit b
MKLSGNFAQRLILSLALCVLAVGVASHVHVTGVYAATSAESSSSRTAASPSPEVSDVEIDENDAYLHSASVKKVGSWLGMNVEQSAIAFQVLSFVLLAGGLGYVAWKIIPGALRSRNDSIQKNLADARTATEEARGRLSVVEDRLAKLDGEIAAMRTQSEQDSIRDEQRIKATVEDEKKKILAAAEQEIAAATMHAQKQLQQHAAELAIEQAAADGR